MIYIIIASLQEFSLKFLCMQDSQVQLTDLSKFNLSDRGLKMVHQKGLKLRYFMNQLDVKPFVNQRLCKLIHLVRLWKWSYVRNSPLLLHGDLYLFLQDEPSIMAQTVSVSLKVKICARKDQDYSMRNSEFQNEAWKCEFAKLGCSSG